jgi:hypothetical protein
MTPTIALLALLTTFHPSGPTSPTPDHRLDMRQDTLTFEGTGGGPGSLYVCPPDCAVFESEPSGPTTSIVLQPLPSTSQPLYAAPETISTPEPPLLAMLSMGLLALSAIMAARARNCKTE